MRKRGRWNKTRDLLGRFDKAAWSLRGSNSKSRTIFPAAETGGSGGGVVDASSEMVEAAERVETMLFPDIIPRGLPVDLNEPPPPWL